MNPGLVFFCLFVFEITKWKDYLIRAVSWNIIDASLAQLVAILINQVPIVEDGQQRHQQPPVFVICHPPTIVTLAWKGVKTKISQEHTNLEMLILWTKQYIFVFSFNLALNAPALLIFTCEVR